MESIHPGWIKAAFIAAFISVGIPYWLIPYNTVNLPNALYGPGLVVVVVAALWLRAKGVASFARVLHVMAASVPAAVLARVLIEGMMDPTSHNLWPLEAILAAAVGYAAALFGTLAGQLIHGILNGAGR